MPKWNLLSRRLGQSLRWSCCVARMISWLAILIMGQKEVKSQKKISLFWDLNSIYYNGTVYRSKTMKYQRQNYSFFDISKLQNSKASQLLVNATAS
jgi:hypothetical protein